VDNVVAATGNYKVRIDNATGAGSVADYKGNELIYVKRKHRRNLLCSKQS
ncbi:flagellar protein, partial [Salmonella enterica subsp. enterica serovar Montevideo str. 531954]